MKHLFFLLCISYSMAQTVQIPSSNRAKEAARRVTPTLKKEFAEKNLVWGSKVFIRVLKQESVLEVWVQRGTKFEPFKTYKICHYSGLLGPKTKEGDNQAPEGFYEIRPAQMNPNSSYHLAFNLGYPNAYDQARGYTGDYLMVHGNCVSIGCYAMTDEKIEEIYTVLQTAFEKGQRVVAVHCFPFALTNENMSKHTASKHFSFWKNLQEGYQFFEESRSLPKVKIKEKRYVFQE